MQSAAHQSEHNLESAAQRLAAIVRVAAKVAASDEFGGKWCESITVPRTFFDGVIPQTHNVCICPARVKEAGELVRVDWVFPSIPASLNEFSNLLVLEVEPFIIGCGYVVAENCPEGGVVVRRD